jgi:membrane protease subunit HflC
MDTKKIVFYAVIIILVIIVLSVLTSAIYTVQENQYALVIRFQRVERVVSSPGLNFKIPIIEEVIYFPKTKLFYEITQSDVMTSDRTAMTADCFIIWEIDNPQLFYQRLRTVAAAQGRLESLTYNALQITISTYRQIDLVGEGGDDDVRYYEELEDLAMTIADERTRERLNTEVTRLAQENVAKAGLDTADGGPEGLGIKIIDVKIKSFELPHDNEQAVFGRMISERERFATREKAEGEREATIIRNEVDREANITVSDARARAEQIIAEGESEYMKLLAAAYSGADREEFFRFMRGLDAVRASLSAGDKTLILDRDSLLAQILVSP